METNYWTKITWSSKYVIVATHWAWDDINTDILALMLSEKLSASAVINKTYFKHSNSRAKTYPDFVEDFNRLPFIAWSHEYDWSKKKSPMKDFYDDLEFLASWAKKLSDNGKAVIIHLHWMRDNRSEWIDIWIWMNFKWREISLGSKLNLIIWKQTLGYDVALKMRDEFDLCLKSFWLISNIWENFSAQYKCFWIQYSKVIDNDIFQLEISRELRRDNNLRAISEMIGKVISDIF
ncbi:MAG: hypothetical protein ACD_2C00261G0003 [uncultured bacterium (gcode 4)]|uniref:Uncharacterized protein n=1 Tax=uncultured bacterium (gcode 4) TaxID=1234023 RepID=K2FCW8_9BACT|nr:MAG: hypothetical protein ACD_2C00261G0003 [uncultured bacterium (gcode 4)]